MFSVWTTFWICFLSIQAPLALPILSGLSVSFFLCPSLTFGPGTAIDCTSREQNDSIFPSSQGTKLTQTPLWNQKCYKRPNAWLSGFRLLIRNFTRLLVWKSVFRGTFWMTSVFSDSEFWVLFLLERTMCLTYFYRDIILVLLYGVHYGNSIHAHDV